MTGKPRNPLPLLERYEGWYIKSGTLLHIDVPNRDTGEIGGVLKLPIVAAAAILVRTRRTPVTAVWLRWFRIRLVITIVVAVVVVAAAP
jgi:hypothetical protein